MQAADAEALAVYLAVEGGEGGQDQVEEPEKVTHIKSDQLHDRLRGQQPRRSRHRAADGLEQGLLLVLGDVEVLVPRLLGQPVATLLEDGGGVGLGQVVDACELDCDGGDGRCVEHPPPCGVFCDEAAGQGPDNGSK